MVEPHGGICVCVGAVGVLEVGLEGGDEAVGAGGWDLGFEGGHSAGVG